MTNNISKGEPTPNPPETPSRGTVLRDRLPGLRARRSELIEQVAAAEQHVDSIIESWITGDHPASDSDYRAGQQEYRRLITLRRDYDRAIRRAEKELDQLVDQGHANR